MSNRLSDKSGIYLMLLGASMLSFSPIFFKFSLTTPTTAAFYRMFIGGILLIIISLYKKELKWKSWKHMGYCFVCAVFFALDLTFWHMCIEFVGPGLATLLGNLQVFVLAAYGVFFLKEKLTWKLIVAIPLAVFGVAVVVGLDWTTMEQNMRSGIFYGLLTALTFGLFFIFLRKSQKIDDPLSPSANIAFMSIFCSIMLIMINQGLGENLMISGAKTIGSLMGYAFFGQVLGHVFIVKALPRISPSIAGLLHLIQPALVYVWDLMIFAKPFELIEFTGFIITLSAVYLGSTSET